MRRGGGACSSSPASPPSCSRPGPPGGSPSAGPWPTCNAPPRRRSPSRSGALGAEMQKQTSLPLALASDPEIRRGGAGVGPRRSDRPREPAPRRGGPGHGLGRDLRDAARRDHGRGQQRGRARAASSTGITASRPYFREAMREGAGSQFALGTVSGRAGLYLARRIGAAGGVVVVKIEFDTVEAGWRTNWGRGVRHRGARHRPRGERPGLALHHAPADRRGRTPPHPRGPGFRRRPPRPGAAPSRRGQRGPGAGGTGGAAGPDRAAPRRADPRHRVAAPHPDAPGGDGGARARPGLDHRRPRHGAGLPRPFRAGGPRPAQPRAASCRPPRSGTPWRRACGSGRWSSPTPTGSCGSRSRSGSGRRPSASASGASSPRPVASRRSGSSPPAWPTRSTSRSPRSAPTRTTPPSWSDAAGEKRRPRTPSPSAA